MSNVNQVPKEAGIDHTFTMLREGYQYILNRSMGFQSDVFETRLLGKKTICMVGKDAAEVFYDTEKFQRKDAAPNRLIQTLFGKKGVQTLDGQKHKHRKEMFMSIMSPEQMSQLLDITKKQWDIAVSKWTEMEELILYEESQEILCRIACEWAGVPIEKKDVKRLSKELSAMFESPAALGPEHWSGRNARNKVEKWLSNMVEEVREEKVHLPENTVLHIFAWHRDNEEKLLDPETVAVEVINILRPIVAVSIYINFIAHALHHYPNEREKVESGGEEYAKMFVQEVRRFYPFFPFVAALVKEDFEWNGYTFEKGTLALLDLYGTNHDPKKWENPDIFNPDRFAEWNGNPFDFIPQGGGEYKSNHRCAGEGITVDIMKVSLDYLANKLDYDIPDQDMSYSLVEIPSIPHSKIKIKNIKRRV